MIDDGAGTDASGGIDAPGHVRERLLAAISHADTTELGELWAWLVAEVGHDLASRLWQEALSSSDASET